MSGGAVWAAARLAGAGAGFLAQALLARLLAPEDLGLFFSATSLAAVLALLAAGGYPQVAPGLVARYRAGGRARLLSRFVTQAADESGRLALLLAAAFGTAAALWQSFGPGERPALLLAAASVTALTAVIVAGALAAASRRFALAYLPDALVRPLLFLLAVAGLGATAVAPSAALVTGAFALVAAGVASAQWLLLRRRLPALRPAGGRDRDRRSPLAGRWRRDARALLPTALFTNLFADVAILCATPFLPGADLAVFGLCLKLSLLVGFVIQVAQQTALPDLADARLAADRTAAREAVRRAVLLPTAVTLLALGAAAAAGDRALLVFGPAFAAGAPALAILAGAQAVRAMAGPGAHVLALAGARRAATATCGVALAALLGGMATWAPAFGLAGASSAVLLAIVAWVGATAWELRRLGEPRTDLFA